MSNTNGHNPHPPSVLLGLDGQALGATPEPAPTTPADAAASPPAGPAWPPPDDGKGGWIEIVIRARVRARTDGAVEVLQPVIEAPSPCPLPCVVAAIAPIHLATTDLHRKAAETGMGEGAIVGLTNQLLKQLHAERAPQGPRLVLADAADAQNLIRERARRNGHA